METFFREILKSVKLEEEEMQALVAVGRLREFKKGELLVKENTVCNHFYFIEKGLTRTFYYKEDKDVTDWISKEGEIAVSIVSFISRKPDRRGIEALEDCTVYSFSYQDMEQLYAKYHNLEHLGRLQMNMGLILMQQRFDDLHFATAKERYARLMQENPELILRVPLGMLASFLGMTQETLSRIRSHS